MDKETFAYFSFLRDHDLGIYPKGMKWEQLAKDEREGYLKEAEYYLSKPKEEWPDDILDLLS